MNDNAISRAIAQIHFAILFAVAFCFIVIYVLYLSLSSGIHVEKLKLGPVVAAPLYLKWDKALTVGIGTLTLPGGGDGEPTDLNALKKRLIRALRHADTFWIEGVHVDRFTLGDDINGSLLFTPRGRSRIELNGRRFDLSSAILPVRGGTAYYIASHLSAADFNATAETEGVLQLADGTLYLSGDVNVSGRIHLAVGLHAGTDALTFNAASTRPFDSVAPIVQPLHLSDNIRQWIIDRAKGGPLTLHALRTTLPYDAPADAFDNLYGRLTFQNVRYAFANDPAAFEPAVAREVTLLFKDKRLYITPSDATFYDQSGGKTRLDIDFGRDDPLLTLNLDTTARLTPQLHRLIRSYGIDLPFTQSKGMTDANLTLGVNLDTSHTDASGHFRISKGTLDFSGLPIALENAQVGLKGAQITIRSMRAALFDGNVTAALQGSFDPSKDKGTLGFDVTRAQHPLGSGTIALKNSSAPLHFDYRFSPKGDSVRFDASRWTFGEHNLTLAAFKAPFSFGNLLLSLPKTGVTFDETAKAGVEGNISLSDPSATLIADLTYLKAGTLQNAQPHTRFRIRADRDLTISTDAVTRWKADETVVSVSPVTVARRGRALQLFPASVTVERQLSGTVEGVFEPDTMATELNVTQFRFQDDTLGKLFQSRERFSVYVVPIEDEFDVVVPSINMLYSTMGKGWKLHFFSLDAFREKSPLLDEYNLTQSTFTAWSQNGGYPVAFKGAVDYPYALTAVENKPVSLYRFDGNIESNSSIRMRINDRIRLEVNDVIRIHSDGVAFNQQELTRFYDDHQSDAEENASSSPQKAVYIDANDTAVLFADGRKAKADRITIAYENGRILSHLYKGNGGAKLEVKGEKFYLFGYRLDDDFMEHIFNLSRFKNGSLDFYIIGDKRDFKGLVKISNTTVYDYVLLNNLFAFINTVPALVTFSLPSYASDGIKVLSAYAELHYHEGNLTISGIKVDSKELDFAGQGVIDYNSNRLQMELTVKTQVAANIRKIPLVGYILVGDDNSVLTTLTVSGPVDNPKIDNTIAKDIIIAPFNILKRAFDFPVHYLKKLENGSADKTAPKEDDNRITSGTPPIK